MREPKVVTEQGSKMTDRLKAMEAKARAAQIAESVEDVTVAEKIIDDYNRACREAGLGGMALISRAQYQAQYGKK